MCICIPNNRYSVPKMDMIKIISFELLHFVYCYDGNDAVVVDNGDDADEDDVSDVYYYYNWMFLMIQVIIKIDRMRNMIMVIMIWRWWSV